MSADQDKLTNEGALHADPLYLSALASLGLKVPQSLKTAPDKNSIAVLPFVNTSGEAEQEYFTDGLTEDIITDLSNVAGFFVIARNSTFAYKGKPMDVRQVAHDLGVRYVLEGSARRAARRVRINVQLIDAAGGGNHVWAERFDRDLADIFAIQDEVAHRVVEAISGKLREAPNFERRRPNNLEAYELCVRSRSLWWRTVAANQEALAMLERAVTLDPAYAEAHWQLALVQFCSWGIWGEDPDPNRGKALLSARRAVDLDPLDSSARWVLGYVVLHERHWDEADVLLQDAIRLNPNDADAHAIHSEFRIMNGEAAAAIEPAMTALRLNPRPPGWYYWMLGIAQIANGQYDAAVATLRREETYATVSRRTLAAALALLGRQEEANAEARLYLAANPHWRISDWTDRHPIRSAEDTEFWVDAYARAGLPL
jgi:adenylate cyclase